ncbi:outer membrane beta-barrel protein [Candidatus Protochlamydia amoebophila]|uniref:Outer membrane protein beta-barrel domain-containing protein n=1 Tax=Candidatus Protochlamydia amoebophila TaxID=362787 RepID=A0A0C1HB91_9BACT|nr:outer membrane beta-barrel protein [Candidatus Protochlamydia amoebophila]KIC72063.1 hypothetical protein DB44_CR00150 [Candidatus Protochlamydia amoebophila]
MKEFVNATFGLEKSFLLEVCWKKFSNNFIPYSTFAFLSTFLLILLSLTNVAASLEIKAEAKSQLFFPASKRFRRIYGNCMGGYEGQVTVFFPKYFQGWINVDGMSKKGHSFYLHDFTRISIVNMSFGMQYTYILPRNLSFYVGLGPSFGIVKLENRFFGIHTNKIYFAFGGVFKTGFYYDINARFFLNMFFDYLYQPNCFKTQVNLGGNKLGLGIGYKF